MPQPTPASEPKKPLTLRERLEALPLPSLLFYALTGSQLTPQN